MYYGFVLTQDFIYFQQYIKMYDITERMIEPDDTDN